MLTFVLLGLLSFDPAATERALKHPEGRLGALQQLFLLDFVALQTARHSSVSQSVVAVALDLDAELDERVLAIRSLSLLKAEDVAHQLGVLFTTPAGVEQTILAREAARTLYQMGAHPLLTQGLAHPDPEVRTLAARSGAGGAFLCTLLRSDPWPMVRAGAAEGLLVVPDGHTCIAHGLQDADEQVIRSTAKTLGELRVKSTIRSLQKLVKNTSRSLDTRITALRALVAMGEFTLAQKILATHLKHGGFVSLTKAAVLALSNSHIPTEAYMGARASASPQVRLTLARVLSQRDDDESRETVRQLLKAAPAQHRSIIRQWVTQSTIDHNHEPEIIDDDQ